MKLLFKKEEYCRITEGIQAAQLKHDATLRNNRNVIKNNHKEIKIPYRDMIKIDFGRKGRL